MDRASGNLVFGEDLVKGDLSGESNLFGYRRNPGIGVDTISGYDNISDSWGWPDVKSDR